MRTGDNGNGIGKETLHLLELACARFGRATHRRSWIPSQLRKAACERCESTHSVGTPQERLRR